MVSARVGRQSLQQATGAEAEGGGEGAECEEKSGIDAESRAGGEGGGEYLCDGERVWTSWARE